MSLHPCFNEKVKGKCGRIHLPVAPRCNIKCNYCHRRYDCVNESRPGVTSTVLSPYQAMTYTKRVLEREPRITVVGIAGPGDPFANPKETLATLRLIRSNFKDMILCLATNGLTLPDYVEELKTLGVSHVTLTINAIDPEIGAKIYQWIRYGKVVFRGVKGARVLIKRQLESLVLLKEAGIKVKVNFIAIPTVNMEHGRSVAKRVAEYGADLFNCIPMFPNPGTKFGSLPQPSAQEIERIRNYAKVYLPQMTHCTRCRADAVGMLGQDSTKAFHQCLSACSRLPLDGSSTRRFVAVATMEGVLINQHLGQAKELEIWARDDTGQYRLKERRKTPPPGGGIDRWVRLSQMLADCSHLLVNGIGHNPKRVLEDSGLKTLEVSGFIQEALESLSKGGDLRWLSKSRIGFCSGGMKGGGCQ